MESGKPLFSVILPDIPRAFVVLYCVEAHIPMSSSSLGILCAFITLFAWGFGDFFLQRAIRIIGSVRTLFVLGFFGSVAVFPFVVRDLIALEGSKLLFPLAAGTTVVIAALFNFEALRRGKLAVVTPVISLELPIAVMGAAFLASEIPSAPESALIFVVFMGIMLAVTTLRATGTHLSDFFEKGAFLALCTSFWMALTTVLVGIAGRETTPLVAVWFTQLFACVGSAALIALRGGFAGILPDLRRHPKLFLSICLFDNAAWISITVAMSLIPIAIASTISEAYVALLVPLGIWFNRERMTRHQIVGIIIVIGGVLALAWVSG